MTSNVGLSGQSRRRRKAEDVVSASTAPSHDEADYYSDSDDEKGHNEKMYNSACAMGRFFLNPSLCCIIAAKHCFRRILKLRASLTQNSKRRPSSKQGRRKLDTIDMALVVGIILSSLVALYCFIPFLFTTTVGASIRRRIHHGSIRPFTDADVNNIPILIPTFDSSIRKNDIGGWMFMQRFFKPTDPVDYGQPDRADLFFIGTFGKPRQIQPNDEEAAAQYWDMVHVDVKRMSKSNMYPEDLETRHDRCRAVNWKTMYHPTCNDIHGIPLSRDYHEDRAKVGDDQIFDSFYISHGYYRDVWVVNQLGLGHDAKTVLKIGRWKHCEFQIGELMEELRDALIMERLTASPRIIDIYSHCGASVQVEALPHEVEEIIVPGDGYIRQDQLHDIDDVKPRNHHTATEKLELALEMAESIADLHGFKDGIIVHDDVQLCQWLRSWDGKLKLGDFNRAEIMDFNEEEQEYCTYYNGAGFGNYRSPEEFDKAYLDEKIDIFSFGNNIYALLTGLWVFYENEDDAVVQKKLRHGELAYVDPRYKERSFAEKKLVEVMEKCWIFEPRERIDIFEVVRLLREAVVENRKLVGDQ